MKYSEYVSKDFSRYLIRALKRIGKSRDRILISSIPRCGSTFLIRSIGQFGPGTTCPNTFDCEFVRDLTHLPNKKFLKTHSLAPELLPKDVRVIFLFGDPLYAIVSTYNKRFDKDHFANCGYTKEEPPDIYNHDDLGYEQIFDSWMYPRKEYPVLALKYEKLFDNKRILEDFLGFKVDLGEKKSRSTELDPALRDHLLNAYASLYEKVVNSPDAVLL